MSAASTNARTAEEETPCASGLLRGNSAPYAREWLKTIAAIAERFFMFETLGGLLVYHGQACELVLQEGHATGDLRFAQSVQQDRPLEPVRMQKGEIAIVV